MVTGRRSATGGCMVGDIRAWRRGYRRTRGGPRPDAYIDLNADLGEEVTDDAALLAVVTSANVACGYHAGNAAIMRAVCDEAARRGVSVGAQVSYADRENFGRVARDVPARRAARPGRRPGRRRCPRSRRRAGRRSRYVKPHGALYHRVVDDEEQAAAVLAGSGDLPVLGLPGGLLLDAGRGRRARRVFREGFPDRAYADGRPAGARGPSRGRCSTGAERDRRAGRRAGAVDRSGADSLCVHGDSPGAVEHARAVRAALEEAGLTLRAL